MQEQLTAAVESLREAQLTLEESTKKVADLEGQLTTLTEENNANKAQIAALTTDLEVARANKEAAEVYLLSVEHSIQMALNALNGVTPAPTAEPTPAPTAEPTAEPEATEAPAEDIVVVDVPAVEAEAVEPTPEVTAEPAPVEEAKAVEPTPEVTAEPAPVEEAEAVEPTPEATVEPAPAVEAEAVEPTPEVTAEPVAEPVVLPEVQYPIVSVTDEGSVIETETAVVTFRVDENNAIAALSATVNGEAVAEDVIALFIGKTLPLNAEEFTLDEAGVMQAIIDALNVNAESNG